MIVEDVLAHAVHASLNASALVSALSAIEPVPAEVHTLRKAKRAIAQGEAVTARVGARAFRAAFAVGAYGTAITAVVWIQVGVGAGAIAFILAATPVGAAAEAAHLIVGTDVSTSTAVGGVGDNVCAAILTVLLREIAHCQFAHAIDAGLATPAGHVAATTMKSIRCSIYARAVAIGLGATPVHSA